MVITVVLLNIFQKTMWNFSAWNSRSSEEDLYRLLGGIQKGIISDAYCNYQMLTNINN